MIEPSVSRIALSAVVAAALTLSPVSPVNVAFDGGSQAFAQGKSGSRGNSGGNGGSSSSRGKSDQAHGRSASSNRGNSDHGSRGNSGNNGRSGTLMSLFTDDPGKSGAAHGGGKPDFAGKVNGRAASATRAPEGEVIAVSTPEEAPVPEVSVRRNLHARLGGLNSLKRNINGMMNSADPRMEGIREYIRASAEGETLAGDLEAAQTAVSDAESALDTYLAETLSENGGDPAAYEDLSAEALEARLDELTADPLAEGDEGYEEWLAETNALTDTLNTIEADETYANLTDSLATAEDDLAATQESVDSVGDTTSEESLIAALQEAANPNSDGEFDDDLLEWAREQLGVGEHDGLIDAYAAQQDAAPTEEEELAEDDLTGDV